MTTTVIHETKRRWEGSEENWLKHQEVIRWWADGGEVEQHSAHNGWVTSGSPKFYTFNQYRKAQRKPTFGEVWQHKKIGPMFYTGEGFMSLVSRELCLHCEAMSYAWPDLRTYYAELLLREHEQQQDEHNTYRWLQQQAGR